MMTEPFRYPIPPAFVLTIPRPAMPLDSMYDGAIPRHRRLVAGSIGALSAGHGRWAALMRLGIARRRRRLQAARCLGDVWLADLCRSLADHRQAAIGRMTPGNGSAAHRCGAVVAVAVNPKLV